MRRLHAAALLPILALAPPLAAQDTLPPPPRPVFSANDAKTLGLILAGTGALFLADRAIAEHVQDSAFHDRASGVADMAGHIRSGSITALAAVGAGAYLVGRITGLRELADLGLHGGEAVLLTQGLGLLLKGVTGRARPRVDMTEPLDFGFGRGFDGADHNSFPSTYTILTFTAAGVLSAESSRWWPGCTWVVGPALYGAAALVGFSRMYTNAHWASDVFLAAGLGTYLGRKVVQLHHDRPGNLIDRWLLPSTAPEPGGGVRLRWTVPLR